jgi:hypothetical protein
MPWFRFRIKICVYGVAIQSVRRKDHSVVYFLVEELKQDKVSMAAIVGLQTNYTCPLFCLIVNRNAFSHTFYGSPIAAAEMTRVIILQRSGHVS